MTVHKLKSWPDFFTPVFDGAKNFELRKNDRHFKVGDTLHLLEFDDRTGKYTGRDCKRRISYMIDSVGSGGITPLHGLSRGYAILSLETV